MPMANDQHIQWLLEGAATWNRRRENHDFEPNLSAANIRNAFLEAEGSRRQPQDVRRVRLVGINLKLANLSNAILGDAVLVNADLRDANCSGAYLYGANLAGSRLDNVDLTAADLAYANLNGATLDGANLSRADLTGVDLTDIDLSSANLNGANLTGVQPVELMLRPSEDYQEHGGNRVDYQRIITIDPHRRFGKPVHQEHAHHRRRCLQLPGVRHDPAGNRGRLPGAHRRGPLGLLAARPRNMSGKGLG